MPRFALLRACFTLFCVLAVMGSVSAQEWTRFRGPNGSGISDAEGIPVQWSPADVAWKSKLPGSGHSSPVLWGTRLFITSADVEAGKRYAVCLDSETGKQLWQRDFPLQKYKKHSRNSFATNTPTVDARHVYMLWQAPGSSQLVALTHAGEIAWSRDLGDFKAGHGSAVSPILYGGSVILCNDHQGKSPFLAALDGATGNFVWKIERKSMRPCYATPCVFRPEGRDPELIFSHSFMGITSHDPRTGTKNWEILPFGEFQQRACASPIVTDRWVIGTSGFASAEKNVVLVEPDYGDGATQAKEVYRVSKPAPHVPTPLVYREWMFLWNDRGIVTCLRLADGEQLWQKRVGGNYFGSPICVEGRLYAMDTDGNVVVLAAGDKYEKLASNPLGESSHATPAVAGNALFLRTESHVVCVRGKK